MGIDISINGKDVTRNTTVQDIEAFLGEAADSGKDHAEQYLDYQSIPVKLQFVWDRRSTFGKASATLREINVRLSKDVQGADRK